MEPQQETFLSRLHRESFLVAPDEHENEEEERKMREAEADFQKGVKIISGSEIDFREAADYFIQAAIKGHPRAMYNLGCLYDKGSGVPKNNVKALAWYTKSAQFGYHRAQCNLGIKYERGEGVDKDVEKAIYWLTLSAEQQNVRAMVNLGGLYLEGVDGISKEIANEKAFELFSKAAQSHDLDAYFNLAGMYERGIFPVNKDIHIAKEWYKLAAEMGDKDAAENYEKLQNEITAMEIKQLRDRRLAALGMDGDTNSHSHLAPSKSPRKIKKKVEGGILSTSSMFFP
eukprot:CAMPEP_0174257228 /NCGR_PEP_ID=MMETSP0439-20130205/6399_1 /TAXON_ID=0 /ORGANISM="Stereomyxa ramosa, Strain Chinc5" /LENGTH=285 /DNA_ID=CAMNT_0015340225 /DNA_START=226 /DNA_END=1079 /DNA_ORIENTATION=+